MLLFKLRIASSYNSLNMNLAVIILRQNKENAWNVKNQN